MLISKIKTFFQFSNLMTRKKSSILINPFSFFIDYTFLALDHKAINRQLLQKVKKTQSSPLIQLATKIYDNKQIFESINESIYGHLEIEQLEFRQCIKNSALSKHKGQIMDIKDLFIDARGQITKLINKKSLLLWIQICEILQIVDIPVWNQIITLSLSSYERLKINQQLFVLTSIHNYIKLRYTSFTYWASKFVYDQSFLLDVASTKKLIKFVFNNLHKVQKKDDLILFTNILVQMVQKTSKNTLVNFMQYIIMVRQNFSIFESIIEKSDLETTLNLYKFLSLIGLYQKSLIIKVQSKILQQLQKLEQDYEKRLNVVTKMLHIWSIFNHYNVQIYDKFLKGYMEKYLFGDYGLRYEYIWLHHMVASGIEDFQFIKKLQQQIYIDLPMGNKSTHIVHHYLSIIEDKKGLSSYQCSQHPEVIRILLKNKKIYSNCMQKQFSAKTKQNRKNQHNPVQRYWLKMLQKAFNRLSQKFPHQDNKIFFNMEFCAFELDALVFLNGKFIAFEVIGGNYKLKNLENEYDQKKNGKKMIKYKIIEAYGIQLLEIHTANIIERTIGSFQQTQRGVEYLCRCLTKVLQKT